MASRESRREYAQLVAWAGAEGLIPPEPADANVTVLTTMGRLAVKRITPERVVPYGKAKHFRVTPLRVETVEQMYRLLEFLGRCKHSFLLMETPRSSVENPRGLRRANFFNEDRFWLFLDIDHVEAPDGIDPTSPEAIAYVRGRLPEFLRDVECVAQFTSGAGRSGKEIRLHLAFKLDRPVRTEILRRWAHSHNTEPGALQIDPALFSSVQAHYTGAPVFEGVEDPFEGRERVCKVPGSEPSVLASKIEVATPAPEAADPVDRPAPKCGWTGKASDYLRDEPNGLGLHEAINRLTWEAAARLGPKPTRAQLQALADSIRAAVLANVEAGLLTRRSEYIRSETSFDQIKRSYLGAVRRGAYLRIPEGAAKNFDDAVKDLRRAVDGNPRVPGYTNSDWAWNVARVGRSRLGVQFTADELWDLLREIAGEVDPKIFDRIRAFESEELVSFDRSHSLRAESVIQIESLDEVEFLEGGVTAIRAPYGVGKTKISGARFIRKHDQTLILVHRQSLARNQAERLEAFHYHDRQMSEKLDTLGELIGDAAAVSVIDSLATREVVREAAKGVDAVIIDEAVQVVQHFNSDTAKDRVQRIHALIQELLRKPGVSILLMDAALDTFTAELIRDWSGKPVRIYELSRPRKGRVRLLRSCTKRRAPSALTDEVREALKAGKRVVVATDSKSQAKTLDRYLREKGFQGGCITADTPDAERGAFERAPDQYPQEMDWAYLIYSPAIASGVSMESGWFTRVFGLYHGTIAPHDFMQMLFRVRTVPEWTIAVVAKAATYTDRAETRAAALRRLSGGEAVDEVSKLLLSIRERDEADHRWFALKLVHALEKLGLEIVRVDGADDVEIADELNSLRAALRAAEITEVLQAEVLDDSTAKKLRFSDAKTRSETLALARWRICALLRIEDPETLSAEDVQFVQDHRRVVDLLDCLTAARGRAMDFPWVRAPEAGPLVSRPYLKHRAELFARLLQALGIDPVSGAGEWGKDACREAVSRLAKDHADTLTAMSLTATSPKRPQERVRGLFSRMGLAVETLGSRRKPSYALDPASWSRVTRYAARVVEPGLLLSLSDDDQTRLLFPDLDSDGAHAPDFGILPTWLENALNKGMPVLMSARWLQDQFGVSERTASRRLAAARGVWSDTFHRYTFEIDGAAVEVLAKHEDAERVGRSVEMVTGSTTKLLALENDCQNWSIVGVNYIDSPARSTSFGSDFHPPLARPRPAAPEGALPSWIRTALSQFGLVVLDRRWIEQKMGVKREAAHKRKSAASQIHTFPRYLARIEHPEWKEWTCEFLSGLEQPMIADALSGATGGRVKAISIVEDPGRPSSDYWDHSGSVSRGGLWQGLRAIRARRFGKKDLSCASWLWWMSPPISALL